MAGFLLPEGLWLSRESPRRVGFNGLCDAGGQERNTTVLSGFKNLGIDATRGRAPPIPMRRLVPPASLERRVKLRALEGRNPACATATNQGGAEGLAEGQGLR